MKKSVLPIMMLILPFLSDAQQIVKEIVDPTSFAGDRIHELIEPGTKMEKVASGFRFTEGIAVDPKGNVYFSDIPNDKIYKISSSDTLSLFLEATTPNGLAFDEEGTMYVCESTRGRRLLAVYTDGEIDTLAESYREKRLNSPNDIWIDPSGKMYLTDPRYGNKDNLEQDGEHAYVFKPCCGMLERVESDMEGPNGVTGTSDGKLLYIADHKGKKTYVYDIQPTGMLAKKRLFCDSGSDGMTLDDQGNVYLTTESVDIYNPQGKLIGRIEVPEGSTNVCFAGPERRTLYVTAHTSIYRIEMKVTGVWSN